MRDKFDYDNYKANRDKYNKITSIIASIRLILFIIMVISFIAKYYYYEVLFNVIFIICLVGFVMLIFIHDRYFRLFDYYEKYVNVIDDYIKRFEHKFDSLSDGGIEFVSKDNLYLQDLDVIGDFSLYKLLCIAKSIDGKEKLYKRLSNNKNSNIVSDQEAIDELCHDINFLCNFRVGLSCFDDKKVNLREVFDNTRKNKINRFNDLFIALLFGMLSLCFLMLGIMQIINIRFFYVLFIFNYMASFLYSMIFVSEFRIMDNFTNSFNGCFKIFNMIRDKKFSSEKLKNISCDVNNCSDSINRLYRLDMLSSLKNNILTNFILNGFCMYNLIIMSYFSLFIKNDIGKLENGISNISELESDISLATMGILFNNICMPVVSDKVLMEFSDVKHPLLMEDVCVGNSFESKNGVNIITGSNMGGKTSFLRTIGINLILMNAGTYVCASSFSSCYLKIFTSMRVSDDIQNGISTFYGELLRIKDMISYKDGAMICLIDEIFKGTNYKDRIYGALEVIRKLNNKNTIVMLTTHDFELCDEDNVRNYHVREEYDGDEIVFDYKVREGKCNSTNAKYLMKRLGIIK